MNPTEANRGLTQQFSEAFNRGDLDAAASCFTEDCRNHGRQVGRAGVRMVFKEILLQLRILRLRLLQDRNIRVRVFPEREGIKAFGAAFSGATLASLSL